MKSFRRQRWWPYALVVGVVGTLGMLLFSAKVRFLLGGALMSMGYRLQDGAKRYDFAHDQEIRPQEVWEELVEQNDLASGVRGFLKRTPRHPVVALVACMDARIDTNELVGDTRGYYYIVRTAGSVLGEAEQDMLELAVEHGVKVVVLTSHTDCAAEAAARDPHQHAQFPAMTSLVDQREGRVAEFLARPNIKKRIESGQLLVKRLRIDTASDRFMLDTRTASH